jgi:hypothetical protein
MKKKQEISLEGMNMKILKETPVKYIKLDVDMSLPLQQLLIRYAEENIKKEIKESLLIEWAFTDILKKNIKIK